MGIFHIFKFAQMVLNRAKYHIYLINIHLTTLLEFSFMQEFQIQKVVITVISGKYHACIYSFVVFLKAERHQICPAIGHLEHIQFMYNVANEASSKYFPVSGVEISVVVVTNRLREILIHYFKTLISQKFSNID